MEVVEHFSLEDGTARALEIFDVNYENANGNFSSLFGMLNKCRTVAGKRTLRDWIEKPLCNLDQINERLDIVGALLDSAESRDLLTRSYLRQIPDISLLCRKLLNGKASLEDCFRLYRGVRLLKAVDEALAEIRNVPAVQNLLIGPIQRSIRELDRYTCLIESTVEFEAASNEYRIKPEIDENLQQLSEQMKKLRVKAENVAQSLRAKVDCDIKLEANSEIGFFFRVTLKSEKSIRGMNVKIIDTTKGNGVRFSTGALDTLCGDFRDLLEEYHSAQKDLTDNVINVSKGYINCFESVVEVIGILDVLVSFAVVSFMAPTQYVRPELLNTDSEILELFECRHPMVENCLLNSCFIPNDVQLDKKTRFIILTGANSGGKSTYLRSVLLSHIGCFVPCKSARISIVDGIYARVGAGDFQYKGVSTFMAEMIDCASILKKATSHSLVIIDELGRGTSTFDGFGLASSIAEEIVTAKKSYTLFATHFHEMALLSERYPGAIKNFKVDTHHSETGELTILYHISEGIAEKSFGIQIAKIVGFADAIVKDAEAQLAILESDAKAELMKQMPIAQLKEYLATSLNL